MALQGLRVKPDSQKIRGLLQRVEAQLHQRGKS
jgi:hypothetical protein